MDGWVEWIVFSVGMIVVGLALLVFFVNPLLTLLLAGAVGLASWVASGPRRRPDIDPRLDREP